MFAIPKIKRCEQLSVAAVTIAQALVWAGVMIAVAIELRGAPEADSVKEWLTVGAFTSILLASLPSLRRLRDERRDG
jgi:hypothetical protein